MHASTKSALKSVLLPGTVLGALTVILEAKLVPVTAAAADFFYYGVAGITALLDVRFRSSRILLAIANIMLAQRAVLFFSAGHLHSTGSGHIALEAVALLIPINLLIIAFRREHGISWVAVAPLLAVLFLESIFVAIICRPGATDTPALLRIGFIDRAWLTWTRIPQLALLAYGIAVVVLLARALMVRKAVETGLLWSGMATFAACQTHVIGTTATVYWATAMAILAAAIIENSYSLAYHDELTSLPSRRSYNEELLRLQESYSIAAVDIDHFKQFNDTYGHDTGDEVLRMVASRLAHVTGGGKAFRVGGEEFSIIFSGKQLKDVLHHLESLRLSVEQSTFRVRGGMERRQAPRGPDRRSTRIKTEAARMRNDMHELRLTVSIGVAECNSRFNSPEQVIAAADKALYRAKRAGRNRVESAAVRARGSRLKRSIA